MVSRLTLEFLLLVISAHKLLVVCLVNLDWTTELTHGNILLSSGIFKIMINQIAKYLALRFLNPANNPTN